MNEKRFHRQDSTSRDGEGDRLFFITSNLLRRQDSKAMGTGNDPKTAAIAVGIIEVQAQGQHLLQNPCWGLNVANAFFERPGLKTRTLSTLAHCNG